MAADRSNDSTPQSTTQQPLTRDCWFCSAPNPATATRCGFCCHHIDDNPAPERTRSR